MGFEIFLDLTKLKLSEVVKIKFIDNIVVANGNLYIWTNDKSVNKKLLLSKLKRMGAEDAYCKELTVKECEDRKDFVSAWFFDNYNKSSIVRLEEEHQKELVDIQRNIQKAKELINYRIANECKKKEG